MLSDDKILEIARRFTAYEPTIDTLTIRGNDNVVSFAKAVLSEAALQRLADFSQEHGLYDEKNC